MWTYNGLDDYTDGPGKGWSEKSLLVTHHDGHTPGLEQLVIHNCGQGVRRRKACLEESVSSHPQRSYRR